MSLQRVKSWLPQPGRSAIIEYTDRPNIIKAEVLSMGDRTAGDGRDQIARLTSLLHAVAEMAVGTHGRQLWSGLADVLNGQAGPRGAGIRAEKLAALR